MNSATNNDNLQTISEGMRVKGVYMSLPFTGIVKGLGNKLGDNSGARYSRTMNAMEYRVVLDPGFRLPWDSADKDILLFINKANCGRYNDRINAA